MKNSALLKKMKKYYSETPVEELRKDFEEIHSKSTGPLAHDVLNYMRVIPESEIKQRRMYMRMRKRKVVAMLMQCQELLEMASDFYYPGKPIVCNTYVNK